MRKAVALLLLMLSTQGFSESFEGLAFNPESASIDNVTKLPISGIVAIESNGKYIYSSVNGRFAFTGYLVDLWTGKKYTGKEASLSDLNRLPKEKVDRILGDLAFLQDTKETEGENYNYVFVDPHCPHCIQAMTDLSISKDNIRWVLMPMLGNRSTQDSVLLWCAKDKQMALDTLLHHGDAGRLEQSQDCNKTVFQRNLVAARLLSIPGVPYFIRHDGAVKKGYNHDVMNWMNDDV